MIKEQIEQFTIDFNHYPKILKRKKPFGPVLSYSDRNKNTIRIDVKTAVIGEKEKVFQFFVSGHLQKKNSFCKLFFSFAEAYTYIEQKIRENRVRFLFL